MDWESKVSFFSTKIPSHLFSVILGMLMVDCIIVGQGLAGSCLALELLKRGKRFLVIDHPEPNSASRVAAGLFNPITGRTNQPTWKATEIFSTLQEFYSSAERLLGEKFLYNLPIYRPFISEQERLAFKEGAGVNTLRMVAQREWVSHVSRKPIYPESINNPFGGIEISHSGFLNSLVFLDAVKKMLAGQGLLQQEIFNHVELICGETIQYKNIQAVKIIFCDGIGALLNPFFSWAPIKKLRGELLLVKTTLPTDMIINRGIFAVPAGVPDNFIVGSTYQRDSTDGNTAVGLAELTTKYNALFKSKFEPLRETWGHRPTTTDRRPLLGSHPKHKNVCIFNGLGTKGVSLAPFFAVHLADWLEGKTELNREVNIQRFYSLHFNV